MDAHLKTLADKLATVAAEKQALDMAALQKNLSGVLANPAIRNGLLGAGAGGLLGLATGGEDKKRKALQYALLGGLGAGGLTAGAGLLSKATAPAPKELQSKGPGVLAPVAKGVGIGAGAAAGAAGAAGLGLAADHAVSSLSRSSPLARRLIASFSRLPGPLRWGAPIAGGGLAAYEMLSGNK